MVMAKDSSIPSGKNVRASLCSEVRIEKFPTMRLMQEIDVLAKTVLLLVFVTVGAFLVKSDVSTSVQRGTPDALLLTVSMEFLGTIVTILVFAYGRKRFTDEFLDTKVPIAVIRLRQLPAGEIQADDLCEVLSDLYLAHRMKLKHVVAMSNYVCSGACDERLEESVEWLYKQLV